MKTFKYETHLHTKQGSACGEHTGADIVDYYKNLGYSGFVVTDHFVGGNTAVNFKKPWEKAIEQFCAGYEDAKRRGEEIDFDVFFGFEYAYNGTEFLIYGLDKEWLIKNPQIKDLGLESSLRCFREAGGFVIHAHPFREAWYIPKPFRLRPEFTDAVEIFNDKNRASENEKARRYAEKNNLPGIGGGDFHAMNEGESGIEVRRRIKTASEMSEIIKAGDFSLIKSS